MKKRLRTAFSFSGAVIGAGMMTGAEIKKYFGSGYAALIGILISCLLMAIMLFIITKYTTQNDICDVKSLGDDLFGRYSFIFNVLIYFGMVSCCGAMLAGIGELIKLVFGVPQFITSLFIAIMGAIIAHKGIDAIKTVNTVMVPFIAVFVVVMGFVNYGGIASEVQEPYKNIIFSIYNVSLMLPVCCIIKETDKELKRSFSLFVLIVFIVMASVTLMINASDSSSLPLFDSIFKISGPALILYSICLLSASLSTYITIMVNFSHGSRKLFIAVLTSYLISLINIDNIVKYIYPITGILCIICIIKILYNWRRK